MTTPSTSPTPGPPNSVAMLFFAFVLFVMWAIATGSWDILLTGLGFVAIVLVLNVALPAPADAAPAEAPAPPPREPDVWEFALRGDLAGIKRQIDQGQSVNARDAWDLTPMHLAASRDHRTVGFLLKLGADPDLFDKKRETPLHLAAHHGKTEVIRVLAAAGARLDAPNDAGKRPVDLALAEKQQAAVDVLLELGAAPPQPVRTDPQAELVAEERAKLFLQSVGDLPITLRDLVMIGDLHTLRRYLDTGAKVDAQDDDGRTLLHWASKGNYPLVKFLIERNASVNLRDHHGDMPLHFAAEAGTPEIIRRLVRAGADLQARGVGGAIPVDRARAAQALELADVLGELAKYPELSRRGSDAISVA